ncbi:MAG: polyprenol phosphomannose-dependent alpha 1,6 mannosyltransferase MptB [Actinomycetota bacterium]|nr:polyprenol phosphomannose-dependent alpha 1,6 mannosyltransferase MptB [Actinomycetota bacterium]
MTEDQAPAGVKAAAGPALLGLAAAVVIVGLATYRGQWFPAPWSSFSAPGLGSSRLAHWQAFGAYYGTLVVLGLAWMWMLKVVRAEPRFPAWVVLGVFVLWSIPFLVGPSVSSEDVYAYAGLGQLVERGLDPYESGVNALGRAPVVQVSPPFWRDNPSPYGPLYVRAAWLASVATHDSVRGTVVVLRLFGIACLLLLALPVSALARRSGTPPALALAAVLCSPIVLGELVGAAHNEPFMVVLLAAGVAIGLAGLDRRSGARAGRVAPDRGVAVVATGVVLCGAAATVKVPGLLGAVLLGWLWAGSGTSVLRRLPGLIAATVLALAVVVVISLGSGLGLGWVRALDEPQRAYTLLAPFTSLGIVLQQIFVHLGLPSGWVLPVLRPAGTMVGIGLAALLITRADRLGGPLALGLALLVLAATTPAVWAWYMIWGFVFVATVAVPRSLQVAVVALNLTLTPLGFGTLDVTRHPTATAVLMTLVVFAAGAWTLGAIRDRQSGRAGIDLSQMTER